LQHAAIAINLTDDDDAIPMWSNQLLSVTTPNLERKNSCNSAAGADKNAADMANSKSNSRGGSLKSFSEGTYYTY
jgi:hypothetical protein